jgi:hypothetical protein
MAYATKLAPARGRQVAPGARLVTGRFRTCDGLNYGRRNVGRLPGPSSIERQDRSPWLGWPRLAQVAWARWSSNLGFSSYGRHGRFFPSSACIGTTTGRLLLLLVCFCHKRRRVRITGRIRRDDANLRRTDVPHLGSLVPRRPHHGKVMRRAKPGHHYAPVAWSAESALKSRVTRCMIRR